MAKSRTSINRWIREQEVRLGIDTAGNPAVKPHSTLTVMLPSMAAITRLAHAAADTRMAVDPVYDSMCSRTDAMLAEIIEGVGDSPTLPRAKSARRARVRRVMVND